MLTKLPFGMALGVALLLFLTPASAQTETQEVERVSSGHGTAVEDYDESAIQDPERIRNLHTHIMCACVEENWTRTLRNCPDACATPQKTEIMGLVGEGKTDEEIIQWMEDKYGPKVRAAGQGNMPLILSVTALLVLSYFAGGAIRQWKSAGEEAREDRKRLREELDPEEIARIERDLEEIE